MFNPILRISDGTTTVDLLNLHGWLLQDWSPAVAEPKGGGVFRNSPLVNGRKLAYRKVDNITDTFNLVGSKGSQNSMIQSIQELQRLLEKATSYWTSDWQNQPVWIEARAASETEIRYSTIVDYRLTGFGGPFKQPFFGSDCNSATEAILVIEHFIWQETIPGESGECVQLSSIYPSHDVSDIMSGTFHPLASNYDGTFSSQDAGNLIYKNIGVGYCSSIITGLCEAGIVFDSVNIPLNTYISKATLTLTDDTAFTDQIILKVSGQRSTQAATVFTNYNVSFYQRPRTYANQIVELGIGETFGTRDVTNIVKEIVCDLTYDQTLCDNSWGAPGSTYKIAIFIAQSVESIYQLGVERQFCAFDNGSGRAELYIEYSSTGGGSVELGRSATCNQEVFVANKQNRAPITDIYIYDADGGDIPGNWSANLLTLTPPYDLLPANPAVGDIIYFGSNTAYAEGGPFCNLVFDLFSIQTGITGRWYYGGTLFIDSYICGDQINFQTSGVGSIAFVQNLTWSGSQTVNGITGYWIKFQVTAVSTPTPPVQQNRHIYTVVNPYVDIDSIQVPGDIPSLARIMFDSASCSSDGVNTVVAGVRSLSRGENFSAYLNASDIQQPPGVAYAVNFVQGVHIQAEVRSATGRDTHMGGFDPGDGLWANVCSWTFSGELSKQYIGVYHAYIRGWFGNPFLERGGFRLRAVFGSEHNTSYSETNYPNTAVAVATVLDMGQLVIQPNYTIRPDDRVNNVKIYLDAYGEDPQPLWIYHYIEDIILMPSDEWIGCFGMPLTSNIFSYGSGLDIDGITNPRQTRAAQTTIATPSNVYLDANRLIAAEWADIASSEPIFQANSDQRIWFTQYSVNSNVTTYEFRSCGKVCTQRSARYLLSRGSR